MRIARFLRDKLLICEIWTSLAVARLMVAFMPFGWWRKALGPIDGDGPASDEVDRAATERACRLGRAVERVGNRAWFAPVCLPRAMAARWILARRRIPSQIVFGSRRSDETADSKLLFHAWLKVGEVVVTGDWERETFLPFKKSHSGSHEMGGSRPDPELGDVLSTPKR